MSYWVYLNRDGAPIGVERHREGGTYAKCGTDEGALNVTYNYSNTYSLMGFSLRDLDGKVAKDVISQLETLVELLGTKRYDDYWAPTPGNAGHALGILLKWAKANPDAVFEVS